MRTREGIRIMIHGDRAQAVPEGMEAPGVEERGKQQGFANKTELLYERHLAVLRFVGQIKDYGYSRVKLKLPGRCQTYTPDFDVRTEAGVEFHEVKGFMRPDAWEKLKTAAGLFRWAKFYVVKRERGRWSITAL